MVTESFLGEFLVYIGTCLLPNSWEYLCASSLSVTLYIIYPFVHLLIVHLSGIPWASAYLAQTHFSHIPYMVHAQREIFCFPSWSGRGGDLLLSGRSYTQEVGRQTTAEIQKPTNIWQCQTVGRKPLFTSSSLDHIKIYIYITVPPSTVSWNRVSLISLKIKSPHSLQHTPGSRWR